MRRADDRPEISPVGQVLGVYQLSGGMILLSLEDFAGGDLFPEDQYKEI